MTTNTAKNYTFSISEIQEVLGVDKDLEKSVIQEKLKGFKQYPKNIYSLDDLNTIYDLSNEKAKEYAEKRNLERATKAQATRLANKATKVKEEKKAQPKATDDFVELGKLYTQQAKLKVQSAKLAQEQNLLDKQILELEKKMNVR